MVVATLMTAGGANAQVRPPCSATPPVTETNVVIILDSSGSMRGSYDLAQTKWEFAKARAVDYLRQTSNSRKFALWTYDGVTSQEHVSFAAGESANQLISRIESGSLGEPRGGTPLAGTTCDAVDSLIAATANTFAADRVIQLFTDGLENSTPQAHGCSGPTSTRQDFPNYDPDSWQKKILNKLLTGSPDVPGVVCDPTLPTLPTPGLPLVIMNVEEVLSFSNPSASIQPSSPAFSIVDTDQDDKFSQVKNPPLTKNITVDGSGFFQGIAAATGGRYTVIDPNRPGGSVVPQLGDVNGDSCVDLDDYNELVRSFGMTVSPSRPETIAADQNNDRIVDYFDVLAVIQNFGKGC